MRHSYLPALLAPAITALLLSSCSTSVPIGSIVAYGGETSKIPEDFLLCDGHEFPQKGEYVNLFNAIGKSWGGTVDSFFIPDLRGLFLRGVSGVRNDGWEDPEANDPQKRVSLKTNSNNGNQVGSIQKDAFERHHHNTLSGEQIPKNPVKNSYTPGGADGLTNGDTRTADEGTSTETRPKNAYVYYLIRAK